MSAHCLYYLNHYLPLCNLSTDLFLLIFTYHRCPRGRTSASPGRRKKPLCGENSDILAPGQDRKRIGRGGEKNQDVVENVIMTVTTFRVDIVWRGGKLSENGQSLKVTVLACDSCRYVSTHYNFGYVLEYQSV